MSATEVLAMARAAGAGIPLDGGDLVVKSAPRDTIDLLQRRKAEIGAALPSVAIHPAWWPAPHPQVTA